MEPRITTTWQVLDERVVLDVGPWLTVRQQNVVLPNGDELHDYVLLDERDGCLVFAVTQDRRVILLEQYRHGRGEREIGLPSGFPDTGEDPLDAARRELLEETGYTGDDWSHLGSLFANSNRGRQLFHFYLVQNVSQIICPVLEASEQDIAMRLVSLDELEHLTMTNSGAIGMAPMVGILMGLTALRKGEKT